MSEQQPGNTFGLSFIEEQKSENYFSPHSANGQHILLDKNVVSQICETLPDNAYYIEIGAGTGALTQSLVKKGGHVVAYEVDERCEPALNQLRTEGDLDIRFENFLDIPEDHHIFQKPFHIVGNIPFHISEPLFNKLANIDFDSAVLLIGENLAKTITAANPDSKSWSRLSLVAKAYFNIERILDVPRSSFDPPPRVDAEVITMSRVDANEAWKSDAVIRSYRAIFETNATNATVASALKSVVVTPRGDAETGVSKRAANRRSERRIAKMALSSLTSDYNTGYRSRHDSGSSPTSQDMLSIVSKTINEQLLSKPLSGLANHELVKICSAITTAINKRKKSR